MEAKSTLSEAGAEQLSLPGVDELFLTERIAESIAVIKEIASKSEKPLVLQFSGGKDSMCLLALVRDAGVENYVASFMATGLEFKGIIPFVKETCQKYGVRLLISNPSMHKGNIFKRVKQFKTFPGLIATWCCRDLKLRPQKKMLIKEFGKGTFYKLEGIRLHESTRRRSIYAEYTGTPYREDGEFRGSYEVFPIVNWTDRDVLNYLNLKGLPTSGLYKEFGVSGCSWCPFYQPDIYRRILKKMPNHFDRFIELENELNLPSVSGYFFLRDLKKEVLSGVLAEPVEPISEAKRPCMMTFNGELVPTCSVYGHTYVSGVCFRCEDPEPVS